MERKIVVRALGLAVVWCALLGGARMAGAQVVIQTVPVGNPGNAADPYNPTGISNFGSVGYAYNIGKYDVTAGQYTAFLNAVATTDTYGLYNSSMANPASIGVGSVGCGIAQTGTSGNYTYSTTKNPNLPVNWVSWGDAARFCNWLENGQPNASEGPGATETGSYTLNGAITNGRLMAVTRNPGAVWYISTENEWYKAAYYDPSRNSGSGGYWLYPTRSNTAPDNTLSNAATDPNDANYHITSYTDPVNYLTAVGTFASSPSAYGTFDQGGDVYQWNEANFSGFSRGQRGGSFYGGDYLQSGIQGEIFPLYEASNVGFRVSQVPEPASLAVLTLGVVGMLVRRRGVRR